MEFPEFLLRRDLAMRTLAVRRTASTLLGGGCAVFFLMQGWGVFALVFQLWASGLAGLVLLWWLRPTTIGFDFDRRYVRGILKYMFPLGASSFIGLCKGRSLDLFIGWQFGVADLGYFSIVNRVAVILTDLLFTGFRTVAFPLYAARRAAGQAPFGLHLKLAGYSIYPVFLFLGFVILALPQGLPLLLGSQWVISGILASFYLVQLFWCATVGLDNSYINALGRTRIILKQQLYTIPLLIIMVGFSVGESLVVLIMVLVADSLGNFVFRAWHFHRTGVLNWRFYRSIYPLPMLAIAGYLGIGKWIQHFVIDGWAGWVAGNLLGAFFFLIIMLADRRGRALTQEVAGALGAYMSRR